MLLFLHLGKFTGGVRVCIRAFVQVSPPPAVCNLFRQLPACRAPACLHPCKCKWMAGSLTRWMNDPMHGRRGRHNYWHVSESFSRHIRISTEHPPFSEKNQRRDSVGLDFAVFHCMYVCKQRCNMSRKHLRTLEEFSTYNN